MIKYLYTYPLLFNYKGVNGIVVEDPEANQRPKARWEDVARDMRDS